MAQNYYDVLGITRDATVEDSSGVWVHRPVHMLLVAIPVLLIQSLQEIKRAYKKAALTHHPDKATGFHGFCMYIQ